MELLFDVWGWLGRRGRVGGFVLLLIGIGLFLAAFKIWGQLGPTSAHDHWSPAGVLFAGLVLVLAFPTAALGLKRLLSSPPRNPPLLANEHLLQEIAAARRPFHVCLRCRQVFAGRSMRERCAECFSFAECHVVDTDEDLASLESLLRPDQP